MSLANTTGSLEWVGSRDDSKDEGYWRCRVRIDGKRVWMRLPATLGHDDREKATKAALGLAERARTGKITSLLKRKGSAGRSNGEVKKGETLQEWSVRWFEARKARGLRGGRADIGRFKKWITPRLGKLAMVEITKVDIERWVEWIDAQVQAEELAWKTAQNAWGLVSRAMRDAFKSKNLSLRCRDSNPCLDVEPPDRGTVKSKPYLYPSEFLQLVTCEGIPLAVRRAYALAIYLYPRAGELEVLQWESVDLEHGVISLHCAVDHNTREVRAPKGKAPREFEIEPELLPMLRAMRAERPEATRVFEPWPLDKDRADELRANLQVAGVARTALFASDATRRNLTYHDLRATGATWAAIRGDQPLRIMHRAGHKHLTTTMMYVREAENLRVGFGQVFPPLPTVLIEGGAASSVAADPSEDPHRRSQSRSQSKTGLAKRPSISAEIVVRGEGFEPP